MTSLNPNHDQTPASSGHSAHVLPAGRCSVLMVSRTVRRYRLEFFNELRSRLADEDILFDVLYSNPPQCNSGRGDLVDLEWGLHSSSVTFGSGEDPFILQQGVRIATRYKYVILEHAFRNLLMLPLLAMQRLGGPKIGLFGHGMDHQKPPRSIHNRLKLNLSRYSDWYFAYTEGVADLVASSGLKMSRITAFNNAIDTTSLTRAYREISDDQARELRNHLKCHGPVAIFCGSLHAHKDIPGLLQAADMIHASIPDFSLIVIGGGPESSLVTAAAKDRHWIKYLGPIVTTERAKYFRIADVSLMPGMVGLNILDAFALSTPMLTLSDRMHSPEIDYLESGKNGLLVQGGLECLAVEAIRLLGDQERLSAMKHQCRTAAAKYTVETMAEKFCQGVLAWVT